MAEININTVNLEGQIEKLEALIQSYDPQQVVLPEFSGEGRAARQVMEWGRDIIELGSCMNHLLAETAAFLRNAGSSFTDTDERISSQYAGQG